MKYLRTLRDSEKVYPVLINHQFSSIREVMEAVERMTGDLRREGGSSSSVAAKRCNICGALGHLARDCRKKTTTKAFVKTASRAVKVRRADIEEEVDDASEDAISEDEVDEEYGEENEVGASIFQTVANYPAEKRKLTGSSHDEMLKRIRVQPLAPPTQVSRPGRPAAPRPHTVQP